MDLHSMMTSKTADLSFDSSQFGHLQDFEDRALQILPRPVQDYYIGGEGDGTTLKWNRDKFKNYRIIPRTMRDVSQRDIGTTILGEKISMPLGVSPTAFQRMAHPDGECASARAAEAANTIFILSMHSTSTIDEVAQAAPRAIKWMQLTIFKDRDMTLHIVRRAERAGFKALVLTIHTPGGGRSRKRNVAACLDEHALKIAVFQDYVESNSDLSEKYLNNMRKFMQTLNAEPTTLDSIAWLKGVTKLPIILKGILSPEDALMGVKSGASAIFVSNHGGRQFDGLPATIEALPDIIKAVGDKVEVYVDSGIRSGMDIFKALALGAKMAFIGRSILWGLACGGEKGAYTVLELLREELNTTFALTGCSSVNDIVNDMVVHESYFNRSLKEKEADILRKNIKN